MAEAQLLYSGGRAEVKPNTSHQFKQQEDFLLNRELAAEAGFLKKKKAHCHLPHFTCVHTQMS